MIDKSKVSEILRTIEDNTAKLRELVAKEEHRDMQGEFAVIGRAVEILKKKTGVVDTLCEVSLVLGFSNEVSVERLRERLSDLTSDGLLGVERQHEYEERIERLIQGS